MSLLLANDLTLAFGGLTALDTVSFRVEAGQIVSVIGPNGAGKTTLFNVLTGLYQPDQGQVRLLDADITGLRPGKILKKGMARTFQNSRLFKGLTVMDHVRIGAHHRIQYHLIDAWLRTKRYRLEEARITALSKTLLEEVGLSHRANTIATDMSYGEQRRLEIARALATGAKILLLDEPAAGMNANESVDLNQIILKLKAKGLSILLIEHDMRVVMGISDYIYVLDHGQTIAQGVPYDIQNNPAVALAYLGESEVAL